MDADGGLSVHVGVRSIERVSGACMCESTAAAARPLGIESLMNLGEGMARGKQARV